MVGGRFVFRQLSEFQRGRIHVSNHKWKQAAFEFSSVQGIMTSVNLGRDAAVAGLYVGLTELCGGNTVSASLTSMKSFKDLRTAEVSPAILVAARMYIQAEMEGNRIVESSVMGDMSWASAHDPWIRLAFANDLGVVDPSKLNSSFGSRYYEIANASSQLNLLEKKILSFPLANMDGTISTTAESEQVSEVLRMGEEIVKKAGSSDISFYGRWIIGRSLLLRGMLFRFNGNALMAEAMFNAAHDSAVGFEIHRIKALRDRSRWELGQLLLKWEKRESEGQRLIDGLSKLTEPLTNLPSKHMCFSKFIPITSFEELDALVE